MPTTVLIGHGTFRRGDGSFRVPQNTTVEFFVDDNVGIDDSVASSLERQIGVEAGGMSDGVTDQVIERVNRIIDQDPIWENGICVSNRYKIGRRQHGYNALLKNYRLEAIEGASGSIAYKTALAMANVSSPDVDATFTLKRIVGQAAAHGTAADPAIVQWVACRTNMVGRDEADAPLDTPNKRSLDATCCYLTTAACEAMGRPDDCAELETLRWFRDRVLLTRQEGVRDVETYYRTAPAILASLDQSPCRTALLTGLFHTWILPSVASIRSGDYDRAHRIYRDMVLTLLRRFPEDR